MPASKKESFRILDTYFEKTPTETILEDMKNTTQT